MTRPENGKQIRGMDILRHWQALNFELSDNLTWRFLRKIEELSLTDYSEEQIHKALSKTRQLDEAKRFLDFENLGIPNPDLRLTYDEALEEISKPSSLPEEDFGSISQENLATQAYSSSYLNSISDGDYYSDNGLVSEEEILSGFERTSTDELLSEEELDRVQTVRDFNIIYSEHDN